MYGNDLSDLHANFLYEHENYHQGEEQQKVEILILSIAVF